MTSAYRRERDPHGVEVVSPFRFHAFDMAGQLERRGRLHRLHTCYPKSWIPEIQAKSKIDSWPYVAAAAKLVTRNFPRAKHQSNRLVVRDFDRHLARERFNAHIVIALSGFATKSLAEAKKQGNVRIIVDRGAVHIEEQQRIVSQERERWGLPPKDIDKWIIDRELAEYEFAHAIFVPSERVRQTFEERGIPRSKVHVLRLGVDTAEFWPRGRQAQCPARPRVVLAVGRVDVGKGVGYLVEAFRRLALENTELRFVGPYDSALVRRLSLDTDPSVHLVGALPRSRVAGEMRDATAMVLASTEDGFGMVVPQAMSTGLPVIVSDGAGAAEVVAHQRTGLIVPAGDSEALEQALRALLEDADKTREMGLAAADSVATSLTWDSYGDNLAAILDSLVVEE